MKANIIYENRQNSKQMVNYSIQNLFPSKFSKKTYNLEGFLSKENIQENE